MSSLTYFFLPICQIMAKYCFGHGTNVALFVDLAHFVPATLDSAVTIGKFGAKNFLIRDGKHSVSCVYYENVSRASSGTFQNIYASAVL